MFDIYSTHHQHQKQKHHSQPVRQTTPSFLLASKQASKQTNHRCSFIHSFVHSFVFVVPSFLQTNKRNETKRHILLLPYPIPIPIPIHPFYAPLLPPISPSPFPTPPPPHTQHNVSTRSPHPPPLLPLHHHAPHPLPPARPRRRLPRQNYHLKHLGRHPALRELRGRWSPCGRRADEPRCCRCVCFPVGIWGRGGGGREERGEWKWKCESVVVL